MPVASKDIPKDQRAFQYPYCDAGFPTLGSDHEMAKIEGAHRNKEYPEFDTKTWRGFLTKQRFKGVKKGKNSSKPLSKDMTLSERRNSGY